MTTIAAIATPLAQSGIGIVRLSGGESVAIADLIFRPQKKGSSLKDKKTHTLTLGYIEDPETKETVDQVLVSVMRAPRSYTGEDVCEINCHGGVRVLRKVLDLCLKGGAQLAGPGEFTKRAFLNGKMDLLKAEGVVDLIGAESDLMQRGAAARLKGHMSQKIASFREELIALASGILANIEYPEEGLIEQSVREIQAKLASIGDSLTKLYRSYEGGRVLKEGIPTAIVGRPNVGKSTLLNLLAGEDLAIVTEIEGTTRDVITSQIRLGKVVLKLSDTAGIRESGDLIESIGVKRSLEAIKQSELVLYMVDNSQPLGPSDRQIIDKVRDKRVIVIVNKSDLPGKTDLEYLESRFPHVVLMSAASGEGAGQLCGLIERMFLQSIADLQSGEIVTNLRQKDCLYRAAEAVTQAGQTLREGFGADIVTIDLEEAISALGELTGQNASQDIIEDIFSRFCIGK